MTITIRIRSQQGQKNFAVQPESRLADFMALLAKDYGMTPQKLAGRLYTDFQHKQPLFSSSFASSTAVKDYLQHGQLIFLRTPHQEETIDEPFEDRIKRMPFEELRELIRRPEAAFVQQRCAHPSNICCMTCLAAWEEFILKVAGMSKLQYEKRCMETRSELGMQQNITNIRMLTQDQLVIRYQGKPSMPTVHISESVGLQLYFFSQQHAFNVKMEATLYGVEDRVLAVTFPFFRPFQGRLTQLMGRLYDDVFQLQDAIARFNFGLERIGTAYITRNRQFTALQLYQSLRRGDKVLLHAQLVDLNTPTYQRENSFLEHKFKEVNGRPRSFQLTQSTPNALKVEAFELSEQAQFLYEKNAVALEQDEGFELRTVKKQIINEAFLDSIDTDCFIVSVGIKQVNDYVNQNTYQKQLERVENTVDFTAFQQLISFSDAELTLEQHAQRCKDNIQLRRALLQQLQASQLKCISDIAFLSAVVFCGILSQAEVVGRPRSEIEDLLRKRL